MQKISNSFLVFNKRKAFSVFLTLFLVCNYSAQAQIKRLIDSNLGPSLQNHGNQSDWKLFPCTIQVSPYGGITYSKLTSPLASDDEESIQQWSSVQGINIDLGLLQIKRLVYRYFHTYPEIGLAFNYGWLEHQGSLMGGQIYLKPQHDYQTRWEIFPRIGVGISYATIPRANFAKLPTDEQDDQSAPPSTEPAQEQEDYQKGRHWDLSFALVTRISIDPHWQLSPSIGFNYLPPIGDTQEEQQDLQEYIVPTNFTASVTLGYTPNPGLIRYPSWEHNKGDRINIGWLSAFKKFTPPSDLVDQEDLIEDTASEQSDNAPDDQTDSKSYYVGGIYGQWSIHVHSNHALTLATEWIWDGALNQKLKKYLRSSPLKISLLGGHEFRWGKLLFGQQLGFYVADSESLSFLAHQALDLYARVGLDYRLTDSLTLGTSVKTNIFIRFKEDDVIRLNKDFIDFRISYSF